MTRDGVSGFSACFSNGFPDSREDLVLLGSGIEALVLPSPELHQVLDNVFPEEMHEIVRE